MSFYKYVKRWWRRETRDKRVLLDFLIGFQNKIENSELKIFQRLPFKVFFDFKTLFNDWRFNIFPIDVDESNDSKLEFTWIVCLLTPMSSSWLSKLTWKRKLIVKVYEKTFWLFSLSRTFCCLHFIGIFSNEATLSTNTLCLLQFLAFSEQLCWLEQI